MSSNTHVACPTLTNKADFKLCIFTRTFCKNVRDSVAVVWICRAEEAALF